MEIKVHQLENLDIAEVLSSETFIQSPGDGLDLLGSLYFQGFDKIIIHQNNLTPEFFDLRTGIAGEILQKFSNYRVHLAIVGNFSSYKGKSIEAFLYESNNGRQVNFVNSTSEALTRMSQN